MEKKFGIFNTVEELNRAAAAQKAEGEIGRASCRERV